jgi:hypothetical protein
MRKHTREEAVLEVKKTTERRWKGAACAMFDQQHVWFAVAFASAAAHSSCNVWSECLIDYNKQVKVVDVHLCVECGSSWACW